MTSRWERLEADLAAAGIPVTVDAKPYAESSYGRVRHGVSRSITQRLADGRLVHVRDQQWRKNADVWVGWCVSVDAPNGIVARTWPATKIRSQVVAAMREATATEGAMS